MHVKSVEVMRVEGNFGSLASSEQEELVFWAATMASH